MSNEKPALRLSRAALLEMMCAGRKSLAKVVAFLAQGWESRATQKQSGVHLNFGTAKCSFTPKSGGTGFN
jgi:hypothetical protein